MEMRLLCSFSHTRFKTLQRQWARQRIGLAGYAGLGTNRRESLREPGLLARMRFPSGEIEASIRLPRAAGFSVGRRVIQVCAGDTLHVLDRSSLRRLRSVRYPAFNNLRSLVRTAEGFLAADAGVDTVFSLDRNLRVLGAWNATEHGFDRNPGGELRRVDLTQRHRSRVYPTLQQTTHLNAAIQNGVPGSFLVSLFHQGSVLRVRPNGLHSSWLGGLRAPHSLRRCKDGSILLVDSWSNTILRVHGRRRRTFDLQGVTDWLQDAFDLGADRYLVADAGHHRVLHLNARTREVLDVMPYSAEWKIFHIELLS